MGQEDPCQQPGQHFNPWLDLIVTDARQEVEGGAEIWVWGDTKVINIGLNAVVGRPKNEWGMEPAQFSHMRKAAY